MLRRLRILGWLIAGLLAVGLIMTVLSANESARRSQCRNNLLQIGLALKSYAGNGSFPPGTVANKNLPPERRLSWLVELGKGSFYSANVVLVVSEMKAWDDEANLNPKNLIGRKEEGQSKCPARDFSLCICPDNAISSDNKFPVPNELCWYQRTWV